MKKVTMFICMILVIAICVSSLSFAANNTVKGKVVVSLLLSKDEINQFKSALEDTKKIGEDYYKRMLLTTTDKDKINQIKKMLQYSQAINIDDMFIYNADGSAILEIPYANSELQINGRLIRTDKKGYFEIGNIEDKEYEVSISRENLNIATQKVKFDKSKGSNDIKIVRTLNDLGKGIMRMGNEMEAEGQAITFYPQKPVGDYYGTGVGRSKIYKDVNIVGCNKHDKDYGEEITAVQFALRNSDCAVSVRLGLLSIANPLWPLVQLYPYSEYCVDEAIGSDENSTLENIYCNGKSTMRNGTSKGTHINCSWFSGIEHSESFHTH